MPRLRVKTIGATFFPAAETSFGEDERPGRKPYSPTAPRPPERKYTRVAVPKDVIKFEDRVYYLLQPPLELLLASRSLGMPFEPFRHQFDGIGFLYPRTGAVLADEMGLGKTMQAVTSLRLLLHAGQVRRALLVCPKPLVSNWRREFETWAPELPLTVVEGDQPRRHWQWRHPDSVIAIANYELVLRDRELLCGGDLQFDLVIVDEAQRIKNANSTTNRVVRSLPRRRSWAITGTPIENSPEDLVGIFEFVARGHLRRNMKPRRMATAVSDYVLRRTKEQVLDDLPPKLFRDADLELSPEQWETYRLAEDEGAVRLSALGDRVPIQHVLELILRLKQVCNRDPATGASSKLERLEADLEECAASGRKAIVFSQWVETLTWLSRRLKRFQPLEYHGRVPTGRRDGILERFRSGESVVLLMSYGAGSVGLNLQFANYVFLFDRWWNPAVEDQAINRVHRIGSSGPVTVSRYLTLGTIEQRIDQILREKRELFDTVFNDGLSAPSRGLRRDEIFGLLNLQPPANRAA